MRILVLSVGITVLTTTLLFVYFRNKMTNMDHKVNLVLKTIQDHQQNIAKQDFLRQQHMHQISHQMQHIDEEENMEESFNEESFKEEIIKNNNVPLIEVSDLEEKNNIEFSDSDTESESESESETEDEDEKEDVKELEKIKEDKLNFDKKVENQEENQEETVEETVEEIQEDLEQIDYYSLSKVKLQSLCEERNISEYRKSHNKSKLIELLSNN